MKKLFVVSKTHLDLGFTDYAENIRKKYIHEFIPNAVSLAKQVNTPEQKSFVWTTGSWILKEALEHGTPEQKENLKAAIQNGDVVPHALPVTMHTELLDADTLDYGLSVVESLDALRGRKTVAAKMTDVPGHTKALVKHLWLHGIKLLHIGVNGASALPEVPPCFLWKCGEAEVVVIYSGDYGGSFQCDFAEEILYFDHTLDNHGAPAPQKVLSKLDALRRQYPDYTVEAGCLDDFAEILWEHKDKLPVFTGEIGDTWIHGSAADPYKSAALRELMRLKREWLADGSLVKNSEEYIGMSDALLCIAEHTCGMDGKMYFADFEHYLKPDFEKARQKDKVHMRHPLRDFPQNGYTWFNRLTGRYKQGSYSVIEKSWAEQRLYIQKAVAALSAEHRAQAEKALARLIPQAPVHMKECLDPFMRFTCGDWTFQLNAQGGIGSLTHKDETVVAENDRPVLEYRSFSDEDYEYWLTHYTRNRKETESWSVADFARPLLKYVHGKYPSGRFPYAVRKAAAEQNEDTYRICVDLQCEPMLCEQLGAPRLCQILYTLSENGVQMELSWFKKDASRLTEALYLRLFPSNGELRLTKIGEPIAPDSVVSMGGRNLHAVSDVRLTTEKNTYICQNHHAPLVSVGRGKILEYDNAQEDFRKDGISFVLHNNVWGTNFPLWYADNAYFQFDIQAE